MHTTWVQRRRKGIFMHNPCGRDQSNDSQRAQPPRMWASWQAQTCAIIRQSNLQQGKFSSPILHLDDQLGAHIQSCIVFACGELQYTILIRFRLQSTLLSKYVEHAHKSKSILDENSRTKHVVTLLVPCGSSWLMQPIICLTKAHEAFCIVKKNKVDKRVILLFQFGCKTIQRGRRIIHGSQHRMAH